MNAELRELVRQRAGNRCEYCRLPQELAPFVRFQIGHVIPRKHGGGDEEANLALACDRCNLHKGPNLSWIDSVTGNIVPLYHPRRDVWEEHFQFDWGRIVGLTATGRAPVEVCQMNARRRVQLRLQHRADYDPH